MRVLGACAQYIFGEEGRNDGTPHLQGCVHFKAKQRFTAVAKLFKGKGVHWEKMKKPFKVSVVYCTKEMAGDWSKIHGNIPEASRLRPWEQEVLDTEYKDVVWKPWQKDIIDIIEGEVDGRSIYWYWEPVGNIGKSFLTKYLYLTYECVVGGGKAADVAHQLAKRFEPGGPGPPLLVLLDVPRSSFNFFNYGMVEKLKDAFVVSGKYEGCVVCCKKPHVIIFANQLPSLDPENTWSEDRIIIKRIWKPRTVAEAIGAARLRGADRLLRSQPSTPGKSSNMI